MHRFGELGVNFTRLLRPVSYFGGPIPKLESWLPFTFEWIVSVTLSIPPAIVAITVFALIVRPKRAIDNHTRCGNCDHILKGLSEPRCPECGVRI